MGLTVFLDWGLAFGAGVLFAIAGRSEVEHSPRSIFTTRSFRWGLAYLHLGVLTISLTLYAMARDWMWMYWVDPRRLPVGIQVLVFLLYEVCFVAGFAVAAQLSRRACVALAGITAAAITFLELTARTRLFHFGTLREFSAGTAPPAITLLPYHALPEWWVAFAAGSVSLVVLIVMLVRLYRRSATVGARLSGL